MFDESSVENGHHILANETVSTDDFPIADLMAVMAGSMVLANTAALNRSGWHLAQWEQEAEGPGHWDEV